MSFFARHVKVLPAVLLAVMAVATSIHVGCGGIVENKQASTSALGGDGAGGDGYGYGSYGDYGGGDDYGYGYGGYDDYGYGSYGGGP